MRSFLLDGVKSQLPKGFDLRHFTPRYNPWDQRLCLVTDGDLFKNIQAGKVCIAFVTVC